MAVKMTESSRAKWQRHVTRKGNLRNLSETAPGTISANSFTVSGRAIRKWIFETQVVVEVAEHSAERIAALEWLQGEDRVHVRPSHGLSLITQLCLNIYTVIPVTWTQWLVATFSLNTDQFQYPVTVTENLACHLTLWVGSSNIWLEYLQFMSECGRLFRESG
jgi:hypothetical protein